MTTSVPEAPPGPGLTSERIAGGILPKVLNSFDMVAIFVAIVLFIISKYRVDFEQRKIANPTVFWISSVVGMIACAWGAIVTFTNPWAPLFSKGDWFKAVLLLSVVSLAVAPVVYILGSSAAREDRLPPEAEAVAGAGS